MVRIQVLLSREERETFRRLAVRDGVSLSAWLRGAGLEKLAASRVRGRIRSHDDLDAFFAVCDAHHGSGREPDWAEHLETMRRSRDHGGSSGT